MVYIFKRRRLVPYENPRKPFLQRMMFTVNILRKRFVGTVRQFIYFSNHSLNYICLRSSSTDLYDCTIRRVLLSFLLFDRLLLNEKKRK